VLNHAIKPRSRGVTHYRDAKNELCVRLVRKKRSILPFVVAARGLA